MFNVCVKTVLVNLQFYYSNNIMTYMQDNHDKDVIVAMFRTNKHNLISFYTIGLKNHKRGL